MKTSMAWLMLVGAVFAARAAPTESPRYNRILVAGRLKFQTSVFLNATNPLTVAAALEAAGNVSSLLPELRVSILPDTVISSPANSSRVITGAPASSAILTRALSTGDTVLVQSLGPTSVMTNLQVLVIGDAKMEGIVEFEDPRTCTMVHLIFKVGSLPIYANRGPLWRMRIERDGAVKMQLFDAQRVFDNGAGAADDVVLQDGDVVIFPRRIIPWF
jgi:hypothetical protein